MAPIESEIRMKHYLMFRRSARERTAIQDSGYRWAALVFSPLWAIREGLTLHGVILAGLWVSGAALIGNLTHGIVVGAAIAMWLGAFTAHHATDWLTTSYERRGYRRTGGIDADSVEAALRAYREPTRPTVLLENASPAQLRELL